MRRPDLLARLLVDSDDAAVESAKINESVPHRNVSTLRGVETLARYRGEPRLIVPNRLAGRAIQGEDVVIWGDIVKNPIRNERSR